MKKLKSIYYIEGCRIMHKTINLLQDWLGEKIKENTSPTAITI